MGRSVMRHDAMDMDEAVAEWVLGLLRPESLPSVCLARLDDDVESEALVLLATEKSPTSDSDQTLRWFEQAVLDLRIDIPTPEAAAEFLIGKVATAALAGEISLQSALVRIADQIYNSACGPGSDTTYVGDALGIDEHVVATASV